MQTLDSNKQRIFYATYVGMEDVLKDGLKTGQKRKVYSDPIPLFCNVSQSKGSADVEIFGINSDYDRVIVTHNMILPIKEDTILWVSKYGEDVDTSKPYNYRVVRVARSINSATYAIKEVSVS